MDTKIFDSELAILDMLWDQGPMRAVEIAAKAAGQVGWSKSTTYTVLKKCVQKGLVGRQDPGFVCEALVTREQVQESETKTLIDRMYGGRADSLVASLLQGKALSGEEIGRLRALVEEMK